ncbi:hypothetical protein [Pedobacter gandavensis]|uniref:hypothetical protein n=1 Tax=Pedobacter gandavensis TaxID=2679963 RepID=UPI00293136FB|nr:hypothetical protein [Pedobacter gandavensis]
MNTFEFTSRLLFVLIWAVSIGTDRHKAIGRPFFLPQQQPPPAISIASWKKWCAQNY